MKNLSVKKPLRLAALILALVFALVFTACGPKKEEGKQDADSTAVPERTAAPNTADATPGPEGPPITPPPAATVLAFEECAEEILRLQPVKVYCGPLPDDAPDDAVLYFYNTEGDVSALGPRAFAVDGETVAVCDMEGSLAVYGAGGRLIRRIDGVFPDQGQAALAGGMLYSPTRLCDIETGELVHEYSPLSGLYTMQMQWGGSVPKLIVEYGSDESGEYTLYDDYYQFDSENGWTKVEPLCQRIEDYYGEWTKVIFPNGTEVTFSDVGGYRVLGMDADGNYYFDRIYNTHTVIKVSSDGTILSQVEIPFDTDDLWAPDISVYLAQDGTVYAAAALINEYLIWRIGL